MHEAADLVSLTHNNANDYTLVVYRTELGEVRQVLRRKGVVELIVITYDGGEAFVKERGYELREIGYRELARVQDHIEGLIYAAPSHAEASENSQTL